MLAMAARFEDAAVLLLFLDQCGYVLLVQLAIAMVLMLARRRQRDVILLLSMLNAALLPDYLMCRVPISFFFIAIPVAEC